MTREEFNNLNQRHISVMLCVTAAGASHAAGAYSPARGCLQLWSPPACHFTRTGE